MFLLIHARINKGRHIVLEQICVCARYYERNYYENIMIEDME
jgi:hypothetical protein